MSAKFLEQRASLLTLHHELFDAGLVVWSGGNISQRVEGGFSVSYTHLTLPTNREV